MSRKFKRQHEGEYIPTPEEIRKETAVIHPLDEHFYGLEVRSIDGKTVVIRPVRIESFLEICKETLSRSDEQIANAHNRLRSIGERLAAVQRSGLERISR